MSQQPFLRLLHGRTQLRTFSRTSLFFQRVPPKPSIRKPTVKSQLPPISIPTVKADPTPKPNLKVPAQHNGPEPAPSTAAEPIAPQIPLKTYTPIERASPAARLLGDAERLTLYKAPKHTAFAISSYFSGASLVSYGLMHGNFVLNISSGYVAILLAVGCTISALFGCALFMAPMKLIKSISVVRTSEGLAALRFEGRRRIPFRKPKAFEADPRDVFANKDVPMSLQTWHDVKFRNAEEWTNTEKPFSQPILDPPSRWMSYVRRMFNRDGMVYMKIRDQGLWKVDLNECEILEGGSPLMKVVQPDPTVSQGILWKMFKNVGPQSK